MYKLVKVIGHIATWFICAITIDKIDISESIILNYFIISPIISEILWASAYWTCNKTVYKKLHIKNKIAGSIGYTIFYIIYAVALFAILITLKKLEIIPFANNFDVSLIEVITQYFENLIIDFTYKIVEVLTN